MGSGNGFSGNCNLHSVVYTRSLLSKGFKRNVESSIVMLKLIFVRVLHVMGMINYFVIILFII